MQTRRKQTGCLFMMMLMMIGTCGCTKEERAQETTEIELDEAEHAEDKEEKEKDSQAKVEAEIYVYVCGQVSRPGVYCLKGGSRIYEALEAAGGVLEGAAPEVLNQAGKVTDGEKIYVPSKEEQQEIPNQEPSVVEDGKTNINTADKTQLMTLPGIGEAKAEKIIQYREENGGFQKIEDIMQIQGIKEGVYENIKELVKV